MHKNDYIKLNVTEYGYEIYAITSNSTHQLSTKDKLIMHEILKVYPFKQINNNTFIFPNYNQIIRHFNHNKANLKSKPKKVNRSKSRLIINGIILAGVLASAAKGFNETQINKTPEIKADAIGTQFHSTSETLTTTPIVNIDNIDYELHFQNNSEKTTPTASQEEYEATSPHIEETHTEEYETISPNLDEFYDEEGNQIKNPSTEISEANTFTYEFDTPGDKEALNNSTQYMEVFKKYEKIYGVDANLLCAIGAQESSGIHYRESKNGGHATGIMGIENIWDKGEIRVFNFENNAYETLIVDYSRIGELDYNVKIGAAIFQNYFYSTLKNNTSLDESEQLSFSLQKYNMGPGNMRKILKISDDWINNREMINAGDKLYFEHVLSRLDNNVTISIRLADGSYHTTNIVNASLEKEYGRA